MRSAHLGRSGLANTQIENNLKNVAKQGVNLSADIWAYIMRIHIISKNFPAAVNVFSKLGEHGVSKPSVELWNELLSVHSKLNTPHKKQRVESVWKLLQQAVTPNADSYLYLIQGYVLSGNLDDALKTIGDLKMTKPDLVDDKIKQALLVGLLNAKKLPEAEKLFQLYLKEGFQPNIKFYNKYLTILLKNNQSDNATKLFDMLTADKNVKPDAATWTLIIDLFLRRASKAGKDDSDVMPQLINLLDLMKKDSVALNQSTMTMLIHNLLQDNGKKQIGLKLYEHLKSQDFPRRFKPRY
ncbi:unnamed protein product [Ambrosiozyma monospora]|uniref:Mitochondrial 15S rRNA processing factor CCM1 n=1 Tax=Ambrosiozyma monospora TaxID=43982 RepID=A0A9W6WIE1_AMBMO|nr:unnamed protein product [Ambrosiozyma monospora]